MAIGIRADIPSDVTRTIICVDQLRDNEIYGRCYNLYHSGPPEFVGLAALIGRMEGLFDQVSFPQRTLEPRYFKMNANQMQLRKKGGAQPMVQMKEQEVVRGEKATFVVSVQFRQNATWQGTVGWSEQKKTRHFRSMLELISLMNNAMTQDDGFANWNDDTEKGEK